MIGRNNGCRRMTLMIVTWMALLVVLIATVGKRESAGPLTMSYFLGLSLLHVPGALIYLDPPFFTGADWHISPGIQAFRKAGVPEPAAAPTSEPANASPPAFSDAWNGAWT